MRHVTRRGLGLVAALLLAGGGAHAGAPDPALVEAATKEAQVVWYSTLIVNQIVRPMVDAFQAKYPGIKVHYSRQTNSDIALKIMNETRAHRLQADVFDANSGIYPLLENKLVAAYAPAAAADYPAALKDPDGHWTGMTTFFMTASYNTNEVKGEDVPKSFADLLDPKWKGKIVWTNDPTPQGPPGFVHNVLSTMGEAKGMEYLKTLAAQEPVFIPASQRVVLDKVIAGEYPIGIMIFNHHVAISAAQGAPVQWIRLEPLLETLNLVGLLRDAPHPNAARLLVDFILSVDGQKVLADNDYIPANPLVPAKTPDLKPETGHFKVNLVTPDMARDGMAQWTATYKEIFR